jgi:hypothetical protein
MSDRSARFDFPFLQPGQAQKELFHNEALALIDAVLHPVVEETLASPPLNPSPGQCWIVAEGGTGMWSGRENQLAAWTDGGWRFVRPATGMTVWDAATALPRQWDGAAWSDGRLRCAGLTVAGVQIVGERQPNVPSPSGGTIIDTEARAAVTAVIAALMSHGLIG